MGNFCSLETGHWDPHENVAQAYTAAIRHVYQDMTQPLSNYFISSGHNSYLTGNQLNSRSDTDTIVMCLKKGCRVIELDVYNKPKGGTGPVCKHGGTLTAPVTFEKCVQAIKAYAFVASPYPVIITIENHTDAENQAQMAEILQAVLGPLLFVPAPEDIGKTWKSPAELKNKVLIRTNVSKGCAPPLKRLVYVANSKFTTFADRNASDVMTSSSFVESKVFKILKKAFEMEGLSLSDLMGGDEPGNAAKSPSKRALSKRASSNKRTTPTKPKAPPPGAAVADAVANVAANVAAAASDVVGHPTDAAVADEARGKGLPAEEEGAVSDEEDEDEEVVQGSLEEIFKFTARHLMRVYPAGWRIRSSNYDPTIAWCLGASLAALNWQNWDKPLWINEARFSDNGGCGYVLKPQWMLQPQVGAPLPERSPYTLRVHVYSAFSQQGALAFAWFKDDLFVEISVHGMPQDCDKQQTVTVDNTGRLIVDKYFDFKVSYPELAMLVVELKDDDLPGSSMDDLLGYSVLPLATLQEGDYKLALKDEHGKAVTNKWIKVNLSWVGEAPPLPEAADPSTAPKYVNPLASHPSPRSTATSPRSTAAASPRSAAASPK